ncbi:MAG: hypothetical protein GXO77_17750 [Calditrichaeota bacterium]|nr:hypothetical protein [Calditrichota bacterium]
MKKTFLFTFILFLYALSLKSQTINRIYFDRFTHYTIDDWITYAPATDITSVEIGEDYVFFGTRLGGILRYNLYEKYWDFPFTTSSGLRSNSIMKLSYDENRRLLFARTPKGVDVYNFAFQYWTPSDDTMPPQRQPDPVEMKYFKKEKNPIRYPPYYRPSLRELPDFFTDRKYVFRPPDEILDPFNRTFYLNSERVVDKFNRLWLSTNGLGPAYADLNENTLVIQPQSLPNIYPRDIYLDGNDVWIGGKSNGYVPSGICLWRGNPEEWEYFEAGLIMGIYDHNINAITGTKRFVFFGSQQGLVRYDKKKKEWRTFTRAQRLLSENIRDLLIFENQLFIATDRGFNWMDLNYGSIRRPKNSKLNNILITRIARTDSSLLFATPYGIYQYFPKKDSLTLFKTGSAVFDIQIGAVGVNNDSLWFAGEQGVSFYDPGKKSWTSFTRIRMKFHDIAFTPGVVWFATDRGLLKYIIKRDYWYLYTTRDGLAHNRVYRIDLDGDNMWLSTPSGITLFRWYRQGRFE